MVAVVDDADAVVDVLADSVGIGGRGATYVLVITVDIGVVVVEQVVSDIVDMLVIVFIVVTTASFRFGDALADGQPGRRSIQVSFIVDDFVDVVGDLGCRLATETTDEQFVI